MTRSSTRGRCSPPLCLSPHINADLLQEVPAAPRPRYGRTSPSIPVPMSHNRPHRSPTAGIVAVDISPPLTSVPISPRENILLVTHGLTGGSHEPYVRAVLARATPGAGEGGLGARAVVLNFRGCNGSPVVTPRLYHVRLPSRLPCWARASTYWESSSLRRRQGRRTMSGTSCSGYAIRSRSAAFSGSVRALLSDV